MTISRTETIKKIESLLKEVQDIAKEHLGLENILYNERYVELLMSDKLGHKYNVNTQGGDAFNINQEECEYKAINLRNKSNSSSFQFHWLSENKMEKYRNNKFVYFALRDGAKLIEIYELPMESIILQLEEKKSVTGDIKGHKSFSLENIIELGAIKVYDVNNFN